MGGVEGFEAFVATVAMSVTDKWLRNLLALCVDFNALLSTT